jgi:thermosome
VTRQVQGSDATTGKSQTFKGREVQKNNILIARVVAEVVKTTLGPKGSDKILLDQTGEMTVTNDGAVVLKKIQVVHPVARMMVDIAKTQEEAAGDGTTTVVVLTGELLKQAGDLIDQGVHPTSIVRGYLAAGREAENCFKELAIAVRPTDDGFLKRTAITSLSSKISADMATHLSQLALKAVRHVMSTRLAGERKVPKEYIRVVKRVGGSIRDSEVVKGIVLESDERILKTAGAPRLIENAKIATANTTMTFKRTETNAEISISSGEQIQAFYNEEDEAIEKLADSIVAAGANVILNYKTMDDRLMHLLARKGVLTVKLIPEREIELVAKATGGKVINNINELSPSDLGTAERVEVRKVAEHEFIFIEGCKDPKAITIFLRGGTKDILEELERSMDDAIGVLRDIVEEPAILPGGGAVEMEVSRRLNAFARTVKGREQLAIVGYAKALECVPKVLAQNSGLEPLDAILALRVAHEKGRAEYGIDLRTGKPTDMIRSGVVEPLKVKRQAVASATETAVQILRVDDVVSSKGAPETPVTTGKQEHKT